MNRLYLRRVALVCAIACAVVTAVSVYPRAIRSRAEDRNGDGRPDVWRLFADRGEQVEIDIDSNFDGRPDIQEFYDRGALVRRESDRNFDDRIDLVEEFDTGTREHVRSVVDVDYDGRADLLVLFRDGAPVFSQYASAGARVTRTTDLAAAAHADPPERHGLLPLADPFRADTALHTAGRRLAPADLQIVSTSTGLPVPRAAAGAAIEPAGAMAYADTAATPAPLSAASSRAPPLS